MKLGGKFLSFVLLIAALVLVNFVASFLSARADLTAGRIYTLSEGTKRVLQKIEEPIALQLYFTRSADGIPIEYKNFASRVEEMVRQYVALSKGKVTLKVIDPRPDTDEETTARRSGLEPRTLPTGEAVYFGLVATQADQQKTIPFFVPVREAYLEYDLSQIIYGVQQFNKPKLGLLSGLPLRGGQQEPGQPPPQGQVSAQEWDRTFDIVYIEPTAEKIPEGLAALAVIHPQRPGDKLLYAIDQFILSGKPAFIAVDPVSDFFKAQQQRQGGMFGQVQPGLNSDLPRLFAAWGITFDANNVVGDVDLARRVQTGEGVINYPVWLDLKPANFSRTAPPTSELKTMLLPDSGWFEVAADRGYDVTPLIQTSERAGVVSAMLLNYTSPSEVAKQIADANKKRDLAVLIRGSFKTAFPEGAPKAPPPAPGETNPDGTPKTPPPPEPASAPGLAVSEKPGTVILIADTDWLLDQFSVRSLGMLGLSQPLNDNIVFAANVLDYLGGSDDLISIRGKGTVQRPFEVIQRMERAAQEKNQKRSEEVEQRLADVQKEISGLVSNQDGQRLVVTPEVEAKIASFREQEARLRNERRDIRRDLREGIEALQFRVTLLNFLAVPVFVLSFSVWFFLRRSRRQRAA